MDVSMNVRSHWLLGGGLAVMLLAGCSRAKGPTVVYPYPLAECKVEMEGTEVEYAVLELQGKEDSDKKTTGYYDPDSGIYRFVTSEGDTNQPGVPEGEYVVSVKPGPGTKARIAAKYASADTSGLTLTIAKKAKLLPPLELDAAQSGEATQKPAVSQKGRRNF
jgi:hypothetical protein